jgi:hypothetical protein
VTTNTAGIATAPALTANNTAGSYSVTASAAGVSTTATFSLTNTSPGGAVPVTGFTIFGAAVPQTFITSSTPAEVGVRFRSDVNGAITGVRFYKGAADTGSHTGSLWTSSGTLLATGAFTGETGSGWQLMTFASPVPITANTVYVASYHTSGPYYGTVNGFQNAGVDSGPLHALRDSSSGPNGVYVYSSGGVFPNQSYRSVNYWADVVFVPSLPGTIFGTTVPPTYFADSRPVEMGLKFRSDVAGKITGVRFYKGAGDTTTHTGSLWSSTGTLLATGTFTGETASGWQQLTFATPAPIAANTTYVVSYHSGGPYYASVGYFQSTGIDVAPLHALKDGADGANGLVVYSSGGVFPNQANKSSNYWVDVVFTGN